MKLFVRTSVLAGEWYLEEPGRSRSELDLYCLLRGTCDFSALGQRF